MKNANCPECKSKNIVFNGWRYNKNGNKRLRKCNDCSYIFTLDDGFKGMTYKKEIVKEAVRIYSKGDISLSIVSERLLKKFGLKISRSLILFWCKKFKNLD